VVTFAVDFTGSEHDFQPSAIRPDRDAPYVQAVAEYVNARHTDIMLDTPDLLAQQEVTLRARDLPGMGDMDTSLYLLCREIRQHSTVALSGESADEVFGGYPWFRDERALNANTFPWLAIFPRTGGLPALVTEEVRSVLRPREYIADRYAEALSEVPYLDGETGLDRRMREIFYLNLTRFLPNLLDRKDRMSMAGGLEVRVPFCDHRLVEYVWNIPWEMKTVGDIEKGILRRAVADLLPETVVARRKSAYPSTTNPTYEAAVRDATYSLLADAEAPGFQIFDREKVRATLHDRQWDYRAAVSPAAWLVHLQGINRWMEIYGVRLA
jgi:asparagine synthase (glutamine-hydrolysing)